MDQHTRKSHGLQGWRKVVVASGSLAIVAVGGVATANQAFAERASDPQTGIAKVAFGNAQPGPATTSPVKTGARLGQRPDSTLGQGESSVAGTGDELASALLDAVTGVVPGDGSGFGGQSANQHWPAAVGSFDFAPADGSQEVHVAVGVMDKALFGGAAIECTSDVESCEVSELADGSRLKTYSTVYGGSDMLVAEHYVGDVRVTVSAAVTRAASAAGHQATSPDFGLSLDQLTAIATEPRWSGYSLDSSLGGR